MGRCAAQSALAGVVQKHLIDTPHEWGSADCCTSLANVLVELGFDDPMEAHRDSYRTAHSALRILGRREIIDLARKEFGDLGWPQIEPAMAVDGSVGVAVVDHKMQPVILCEGWWMGKTHKGVVACKKVVACWEPMRREA